MSPRLLPRLATLAALCLLAACSGAPAADAPPACAQAFLPGADSLVSRALRSVESCPVAGVRAEASAILVTLAPPDSAPANQGSGSPWDLRILPATCAPAGARPAGAVALEATPGFTSRCPGGLEQLSTTLAARPPPLRTLEHPPPPEAAPAVPLTAIYIGRLLPALWLLLLLSGAWALASRLRPLLRPPPGGRPRLSTATLLLAAITLGGLALRLLLPPGGAGDIYNSLEDAYSGAQATPDFGLYGRAIEALLHLLTPLRAPDDDMVRALSLTAGTLSLPALAAFVRRVGYPPRVALTAALLLAISPLHVRYSPTVNRYIILIFLVLTGFALLLAWLEQRRPADLLCATLALTLAPQCRPDAIFIPAGAIGLVLAWWLANRHTAPRLPLAPVLVAAVVHLGLVAWPLATVLDTMLNDPALSQSALALGDRLPWAGSHNAFLASTYTPLAWPLAAALGLLRPPPGRLWLHLWLVATALVASVAVASTSIGDNLDTARYHLLAITLLSIFSANAAGWLSPRPAAVLALLLAASATGPLLRTTAPRTMDAEYRFLRTHLPAVPQGCTLVHYDPQGVDLSLRVGAGVLHSAGRRLTQAYDWPVSPLPACAVYYRSAGCDADVPQDAPRRARLCDGLMAQVGAPLAEQDVIARSAEGFPFIRDPLRIGLYWLQRPESSQSSESSTPR